MVSRHRGSAYGLQVPKVSGPIGATQMWVRKKRISGSRVSYVIIDFPI